jgi:broad specificity phosphatase PhoE
VTFYFITHPNVVVSREVPVPRWPLSELGRQRMRAGLRQPWVKDIKAIYCSAEQKAIDGAQILASHLSLPFHQIEELGENDRSATGFLPPDEFERVADQFFASPHTSVRGDRSPSSRTARSALSSTAIWPVSQSPGVGTSRRTAAVTTIRLCGRRAKYFRGGARSTRIPE